MRTPSYDIVQTDEMLQKCFSYLVDSGLENISMRKMCEETGIAMSSAYYWFKNKDDMILNATAWGLDNVATRLFDYVFKYIDNLEIVIIAFSEYAMKYKNELRFVYQVVTSNKYGSEIRPIANRLLNIYDGYSEKISEHFHCNKQEVTPYVYLFVSAILDYVIWNDKVKLEAELACVYKAIKNLAN